MCDNTEPEEPPEGCSAEEMVEHWKMQAYTQFEKVMELDMVATEAESEKEELEERATNAEAELEELEAKHKKTLRAADDASRFKVRAPDPAGRGSRLRWASTDAALRCTACALRWPSPFCWLTRRLFSPPLL